MKFINTLFIIIFCSINLSSQEYPQDLFGPPLGGKLLLSGNFCEFRSNHFHAGCDFRTGSNGKPIYAIADGWVSRIKVKGGGYGNGIYLTHPQGEGYKSVYGHLLKYSPEIQKWVENFQYKIKEFEFDYQLDSNIIPVKKGQLIGYSGNTGYSFGPHLHFEIRNLKDEPYNPQLFGFKIKDTRPPLIKNIAIYPADDTSYVDYGNNSKVFKVYGSSLNKKITVHGNIFFGIEAYDYLNDISSRNAVYKTKLFVDGILIYHSQFDRFSYLHGRDVNSMVDYKRRITSSKRIQRCYVEPNNKLYHYQFVLNQGIYTFFDKQKHTIKFEVSDIYGNTSNVIFEVMSSTKKKNFSIKKDSSMLLKADTSNFFEQPGIEIFFPQKSLFDNLFLNFYTSAGNKYSPIYHIHNKYTPLKKHYILSINTTSIPKKIRDKAVICHIDYEGDLVSYEGEQKNNYLSIFTRSFGKYYLDVDITPPEIESINISKGANLSRYSNIKFKITDNLSGINDWSGFINGKWVLFKYDKKNDLLWHNFDKTTKSGKNTLSLLVIDKVGNISEFKTYFYR